MGTFALPAFTAASIRQRTIPVEQPRTSFLPARSDFLEIVFSPYPRLTPAHG